MCEISNKDTENLKLLPCLSVAKRGYASKGGRGKPFDVRYIGRNPSADARLLLRLPDAASVGCELHVRQPLALAVVNIRAFRLRFLFARTRHNLFCLVFGKKFNIMSALFAHQPLILSQKIDSREGCC